MSISMKTIDFGAGGTDRSGIVRGKVEGARQQVCSDALPVLGADVGREKVLESLDFNEEINSLGL